ncbi:MAG: hypothetical protein IT306_10450 [Chloroflexi bacterium]|nr:hypothetical protein [Chloroflexota bacterium]
MGELLAPVPSSLPTDGVTPADRTPTAPRIVELLRVPERYLRSVHLERDFDDVASLRHYVVTPPMVAVFARMIEGLRPGSGRRAWRITGDYGTGKSSLALVLAHLLREPEAPPLAELRRVIEREIERDRLGLETTRLVPVLVTGAREALVPNVARAIGHTLDRLRGRGRPNRTLEQLRSHAASVSATGDASQLLKLLEGVGHYAAHSGRSGVLLVLDELGKFLEYAALHPDREDVYVLQRLAEAAARSGDCPLVVVGLLHQGFHAYAERLPSTARLEWDKVAGRYEEVTFDQPLAHVAALVAGALSVDVERVPDDVAASAHAVRSATAATGWYGALGDCPAPLELYPLHPMVLPVLVRFFARFGQHERSLFSFLLSSEPFGLQYFACRRASRQDWYRLPDFYDYVRAVFGHRLAGASYRSHWLRIVGTLDRVATTDLNPLELQVLKAVAVLNVLDAEHLLATNVVLAAAISDCESAGAVNEAVASLKRRGLLFDRGAAGGYCLWPSTSVNLEAAFELALRTLGPVDRAASQLTPYLDETPVLARRHYIETGTLRHFEVRHAEPAGLREAVARPTDADGLVIVALCESPEEHRAALALAVDPVIASCAEVLLAVPPPLQNLAAELQDARCWQWVADNTPELAHDTYAAAEVARQVALSRQALLRRLAALFGFRVTSTDVEWWRGGRRLEVPARGGLSAALSEICDELYRKAPRVRNELLNRRSLSSAAAAARLRLIEGIFSSADQPALGIPAGKAPPEKSMYLSVLSAGNVHREQAGQFVLAEPPEHADPLRLRPALARIIALLEEQDGHRVPAPEIFGVVQGRPYGVRAGMAPLLLAIVVAAHAHEIAVYEHGTFLPRCGAPDFLRLIKHPSSFEFQLCRIAGVRAEVFAQLAQLFAAKQPGGRRPDLLDVVRPLTVFAAGFPDYTRRTSVIPELAKSVRDALLVAREPATLLFRDLPLACGLEPFVEDGPANPDHAQFYATTLRAAMDDLRAAYPRLLERIRDRVTRGLEDGAGPPDRADIARRALHVSLVAREPRLVAFARSIADTALSEDAWAEKIGSFVIAKPPAYWTAADEVRAGDEIDLLGGTFCRLEATAFGNGWDAPDVTAVRIAVTVADGNEAARVVRFRAEDEPSLGVLVERLEAALGGTERTELRLAALARLLKNNLAPEPAVG